MCRFSSLRRMIVLVTCLGLLMPEAYVRAETPAAARRPDRSVAPAAIDIAMEEGNQLRGVVTDRKGLPVVGQPVVLTARRNLVASTHTDSEGGFSLNVDRGGVYHLSAAGGFQVLRVWRPSTAPPHAIGQITVVSSTPIVSGQNSPMSALFCNPYIFAATVGLLVAVPVILHNRRDDRTSAS